MMNASVPIANVPSASRKARRSMPPKIPSPAVGQPGAASIRSFLPEATTTFALSRAGDCAVATAIPALPPSATMRFSLRIMTHSFSLSCWLI